MGYRRHYDPGIIYIDSSIAEHTFSCINQRCDQSGVVYHITCNECSQEIHETYNYVGFTRTSVHVRMAGHLKLQNAKNSSGALYRHDLEVHNGDPQGYITEVLGKEKTVHIRS